MIVVRAVPHGDRLRGGDGDFDELAYVPSFQGRPETRLRRPSSEDLYTDGHVRV